MLVDSDRILVVTHDMATLCKIRLHLSEWGASRQHGPGHEALIPGRTTFPVITITTTTTILLAFNLFFFVPCCTMATTIAKRFKLSFHVPASHLEDCKKAIFAVGAGRYPGSGNYTECCFTVMGTGQFCPGDAANPHIGTPGAIEQVQEASVETLCVGEDVARKAVEALKKYVLFCNAHPISIKLPTQLGLEMPTNTNLTYLLELIHMKNPATKFTSWRIFEFQKEH